MIAVERAGPFRRWTKMSVESTSDGTHSEWHAILLGVSMLLQSIQSNISTVHISVKWDWKAKDTTSSLQATKVQCD